MEDWLEASEPEKQNGDEFSGFLFALCIPKLGPKEAEEARNQNMPTGSDQNKTNK